MGLQWPEEKQPSRPRQPRRRDFQTDQIAAMMELEELDDGTTSRSRLQFWLPTLVFILILLALGAVLFTIGPLPTIFPRIQ